MIFSLFNDPTQRSKEAGKTIKEAQLDQEKIRLDKMALCH